MHAVLTAVGELHSLTDWQVSEASEEAELVDFWEREDAVKKVEGKRKWGGGGVRDEKSIGRGESFRSLLMSFRKREVFLFLRGSIDHSLDQK